jgi:hypothetical protein
MKVIHISARVPQTAFESQSILDPCGKEVTFTPINRLDREVVKDLKRFAKAGECEKGTIVEAMSYQGECIGGGLVRCPVATALRQVKNYGETIRKCLIR